MNKKENPGVSRRGAAMLLLFSLAVSVLLGFAMPVHAADGGRTTLRTLRVGFYAYTGYHIMDADGSRSGYAYETLVDAGAAASAELLTTLIPEMGAKITPEIASCLYTGVATDTGCFRFSNTTAETHKAAAALIEAGADVERLNERLFESRSHARVIAERMALESLEFYYDDRCALICLTWDQIQAAGVAGAELEDLTSLPRSIEGVEVGLTLRQQKDGSFKISVRTGHDTNACNIARRLGGGGHPRAAGCEISGNPDNAKHAILEEVKKELDRADAEKAQ